MQKSLAEKIDENKIIFLTSKLSEQDTSEIILKLMKWSNDCPSETINLYITSANYNFINAIAIYDVLVQIKNPIAAYCIGYVGGFSLLFLSVAKKGQRYALEHTTFSLNQPYGSINSGENQQTEVEINANETTKERNEFEEILSKDLNKPLNEIHNDCEVEKELNAKEAQEYGLIDYILE